MLEKERSETLLKIISFVEISQKPLAKQLCPQRTLLVVSQIWISIYEGNI